MDFSLLVDILFCVVIVGRIFVWIGVKIDNFGVDVVCVVIVNF